MPHERVHAGEACAVYVQYQEIKRVLLGILLGDNILITIPMKDISNAFFKRDVGAGWARRHITAGQGICYSRTFHEGCHGEPGHSPVTLLQIAPRNDRPQVKLAAYCQRLAARSLHHREDGILSSSVMVRIQYRGDRLRQ